MAQQKYIIFGRGVSTGLNPAKSNPIQFESFNNAPWGTENIGGNEGAHYLATDAFLFAMQDFFDKENYANYRNEIFARDWFFEEDLEKIYEHVGDAAGITDFGKEVRDWVEAALQPDTSTTPIGAYGPDTWFEKSSELPSWLDHFLIYVEQRDPVAPMLIFKAEVTINTEAFREYVNKDILGNLGDFTAQVAPDNTDPIDKHTLIESSEEAKEASGGQYPLSPATESENPKEVAQSQVDDEQLEKEMEAVKQEFDTKEDGTPLNKHQEPNLEDAAKIEPKNKPKKSATTESKGKVVAAKPNPWEPTHYTYAAAIGSTSSPIYGKSFIRYAPKSGDWRAPFEAMDPWGLLPNNTLVRVVDYGVDDDKEWSQIYLVDDAYLGQEGKSAPENVLLDKLNPKPPAVKVYILNSFLVPLNEAKKTTPVGGKKSQPKKQTKIEKVAKANDGLDWLKRDLCEPVFVPPDGEMVLDPGGEYHLTVHTDYTDGKGKTSTGEPDAQEWWIRQAEAMEKAVIALLEYRNKSFGQLDGESYEEKARNLIGGFKAARIIDESGKGWYINTDTGKLSLLVRVSAKYINGLEDNEEQFDFDKLWGISVFHTATFNVKEMKAQLDEARSILSRYKKDVDVANVEFLDLDLEGEIERLESVIPALERFLNENGYEWRPNSEDAIEIGCNKEFRIQYMLYSMDDKVPSSLKGSGADNPGAKGGQQLGDSSRNSSYIEDLHDIKTKKGLEEYNPDEPFPLTEEEKKQVGKLKRGPSWTLGESKGWDVNIWQTFLKYKSLNGVFEEDKPDLVRNGMFDKATEDATISYNTAYFADEIVPSELGRYKWVSVGQFEHAHAIVSQNVDKLNDSEDHTQSTDSTTAAAIGEKRRSADDKPAGAVPLRIGIKCINDMHPFDSQTNVGYIFYTRDMISTYKSAGGPPNHGEIPWSEFIPQFTYPSPAYKVSQQNDNSKANEQNEKDEKKTEKTEEEFKREEEQLNDPDRKKDKIQKNRKKEDFIGDAMLQIENLENLYNKISNIDDVYMKFFNRIGVDDLVGELAKCLMRGLSPEDIVNSLIYSLLDEIVKYIPDIEFKFIVKNMLPKECQKKVIEELTLTKKIALEKIDSGYAAKFQTEINPKYKSSAFMATANFDGSILSGGIDSFEEEELYEIIDSDDIEKMDLLGAMKKHCEKFITKPDFAQLLTDHLSESARKKIDFKMPGLDMIPSFGSMTSVEDAEGLLNTKLPKPPTVMLPDNLPTADDMQPFVDELRENIQEAVIKMIVKIARQLLEVIVDACKGQDLERQGALPLNENTFPGFDNSLFSAAADFGIPDPQNMLRDPLPGIVAMLTPSELCSLLHGRPSINLVNRIWGEIVRLSTPERPLSLQISKNKIRLFFKLLGSRMDTSICDELARLNEALNRYPFEPNSMYVDDICQDLFIDQLDERCQTLLGMGLTEEECQEQLEAERQHRLNKLKNIADLLSGEDLFDGLVPPLFCTPENPNGLLPSIAENPSIQFAMAQAVQVFVESMRVAYNNDVAAVPVLLIEPNTSANSIAKSIEKLMLESSNDFSTDMGSIAGDFQDQYMTRFDDASAVVSESGLDLVGGSGGITYAVPWLREDLINGMKNIGLSIRKESKWLSKETGDYTDHTGLRTKLEVISEKSKFKLTLEETLRTLSSDDDDTRHVVGSTPVVMKIYEKIDDGTWQEIEEFPSAFILEDPNWLAEMIDKVKTDGLMIPDIEDVGYNTLFFLQLFTDLWLAGAKNNESYNLLKTAEKLHYIYKYFGEQLYPKIYHLIFDNLVDAIVNSPDSFFLASNIRSLDVVSSPIVDDTCVPDTPGESNLLDVINDILGLDDLMDYMKEAYKRNYCLNPLPQDGEPNPVQMSIIEGVIITSMRVFVVKALIKTIFSFPVANPADFMSTELFLDFLRRNVKKSIFAGYEELYDEFEKQNYDMLKRRLKFGDISDKSWMSSRSKAMKFTINEQISFINDNFITLVNNAELNEDNILSTMVKKVCLDPNINLLGVPNISMPGDLKTFLRSLTDNDWQNIEDDAEILVNSLASTAALGPQAFATAAGTALAGLGALSAAETGNPAKVLELLGGIIDDPTQWIEEIAVTLQLLARFENYSKNIDAKDAWENNRFFNHILGSGLDIKPKYKDAKFTERGGFIVEHYLRLEEIENLNPSNILHNELINRSINSKGVVSLDTFDSLMKTLKPLASDAFLQNEFTASGHLKASLPGLIRHAWRAYTNWLADNNVSPIPGFWNDTVNNALYDIAVNDDGTIDIGISNDYWNNVITWVDYKSSGKTIDLTQWRISHWVENFFTGNSAVNGEESAHTLAKMGFSNMVTVETVKESASWSDDFNCWFWADTKNIPVQSHYDGSRGHILKFRYDLDQEKLASYLEALGDMTAVAGISDNSNLVANYNMYLNNPYTYFKSVKLGARLGYVMPLNHVHNSADAPDPAGKETFHEFFNNTIVSGGDVYFDPLAGAGDWNKSVPSALPEMEKTFRVIEYHPGNIDTASEHALDPKEGFLKGYDEDGNHLGTRNVLIVPISTINLSGLETISPSSYEIDVSKAYNEIDSDTFKQELVLEEAGSPMNLTFPSVFLYKGIVEQWLNENGLRPNLDYEEQEGENTKKGPDGKIITISQPYKDARNRAVKKILSSQNAKALFEYVFSPDAPSTLMSMYTFLAAEDRINLKGLFSSSNKIAKSAFESAVFGADPNYVNSDKISMGGISGEIMKAQEIDLNVSPEIWPLIIKTPLLILKGFVESVDPAHSTLKGMKVADQRAKDLGVPCGIPGIEQHHTINDHPYLYWYATPPGVIFGAAEFLTDRELASKRKAERKKGCEEVDKEETDC